MKINFLLVLSLFAAPLQANPLNHEAVSFTTRDGGTLHADYYPAGTKGIVLAHGAVFDKNSWSELINALTANKISALAINFRGYGQSIAGSKPADRFEDILGATKFLREQKNIKDITVLGASMGGGAAATAATQTRFGDMTRLVLLSPMPIDHPENIRADAILYIASRDESGVAAITKQFDLAPEPKQFNLLEGNAHAQHIFKTKQKEALIQSIIGFITNGKL